MKLQSSIIHFLISLLAINLFVLCTHSETTIQLDKNIETVQNLIQTTFNINLQKDSKPFTDYLSGNISPAIHFISKGSGLQYPEIYETLNNYEKQLKKLGWTSNLEYAADGATGSNFVYEINKWRVITMMNWKPTDDVEIPDNIPISEISLKPEEKIITFEFYITSMKQ